MAAIEFLSFAEETGSAEDLAMAAAALARRFAAGATMWCVSPSGRPTGTMWPSSSCIPSSSASGPCRPFTSTAPGWRRPCDCWPGRAMFSWRRARRTTR